MEELPVLQVHMFGRSWITYGNTPVIFSRNNVTRSEKLFMLLLHSGAEGIVRNKLLEDLYGREEILDIANNLRVTCHRLRKTLIGAGLPEYDYITVKNGIYYWSSPMKTEVDALLFRELIEKSYQTEHIDEKMALLKKACEMYAGEFLQNMIGEDWVLLESVQYKNLYSNALTEVFGYLMKKQEYEEVLRLCTPACEMYPFDEWQSVKMDCYIGLNRYKDAFKEYEDTAKLFFEELGISPSDKMMNQLKSMGGHISGRFQVISMIKEDLKETEEETGPFYCSLPSFRDEYRLIRRIMERNGQSIYLMLCALTDGKGHPLENAEKISMMSERLYESIRYCLRRCDSYAKYSPTQFLVLLIGTSGENCKLISRRITQYFSKEHKSWANYLECYVSSIAGGEAEESEIDFVKQN